MFTKEFQQFIDEQDEYISKVYSKGSIRERLLARTVKLSEETGEVSDAVLAYCNDQRKSKMVSDKKKELGQELSDVIIVCALIAKTADVDLSYDIEAKIKKIIKRRDE